MEEEGKEEEEEEEKKKEEEENEEEEEEEEEERCTYDVRGICEPRVRTAGNVGTAETKRIDNRRSISIVCLFQELFVVVKY